MVRLELNNPGIVKFIDRKVREEVKVAALVVSLRMLRETDESIRDAGDRQEQIRSAGPPRSGRTGEIECPAVRRPVLLAPAGAEVRVHHPPRRGRGIPAAQRALRREAGPAAGAAAVGGRTLELAA